MRCRISILAILIIAVATSVAAARTVGPINPVIGNASFVLAYGRAPTVDDPAALRIQTHLAFVEARLRARDVSALPPAARAMRARLLDELHGYWRTGQFPASDTPAGELPVFIDRRGVRCAVGLLVERTAEAGLVEAIDRRYHHARIAQIDAPRFAAWIASSGFTRDELAMIQPAYPGEDREDPDVNTRLAADYRYAVAGDAAMDDPLQVASLQGHIDKQFRHNYYIGAPAVALDAGIGWGSGDQTAYNAHARFGTAGTMHFGSGYGHRIGWSAGIGLDAVGDRVPRAWTVPLDGFYFVRASAATRLGLLTGPRFGLTADRGFGWAAKVQVIWRHVFTHPHWSSPRDLHFEIGVQSAADTTFIGIAIGVASRGRPDSNALAPIVPSA